MSETKFTRYFFFHATFIFKLFINKKLVKGSTYFQIEIHFVLTTIIGLISILAKEAI